MRGGLFLSSIPFAIASTVRKKLYDFNALPVRKLPTKVISVGNITSGGTGKTPIVIAIGEILKEAGIPIAILSRGYGRKSARPYIVKETAQLTYREIGDEPKLISERLNCPIGIAADRFKSGSVLLKKFGQHTIILDDGFSHRKLHRDMNILLLDVHNPFGGGYLPYGMLREPLSAIGRADIIIITGESYPIDNINSISAAVRAKGFNGPIYTAQRVPDSVITPEKMNIPIQSVAGKPFFLFSGIEGHNKFERSAREINIEIAGSISYPDHYPFDAEELLHLQKQAKGIPLLTTEKDLARLHGIDLAIYGLRIRMKISAHESFKEKLLNLHFQNG